MSKNNLKRFYSLLPLLSGLILGLSFYKYWLGFLVFVALIPLFFYITRAKKEKLSLIKFIMPIWAGGILFFLTYLSWMLDIQPGSWAAIDGLPATIGVIFFWVVSALVFSVGFLIFGLAAYYLSSANPARLRSIIILPSLWVLAEFLRSWIYSIAAWGPQATLGNHWNFGNLGFAASSTPLSGLSKLIGLYGLSFLVVVINISIYWAMFERRKRLYSLVVLVSIALLALISAKLYKPNGQDINVGAVQLSSFRSDYGQELLKKIGEQDKQNVELLVLPEESRFYHLPAEDQQAILQSVFKDQPGGVITTDIQSEDNGKNYAVVQYFDSQNGLVSSQQKTFLIPIGEYLPKVVEGFLELTVSDKTIAAYKEKRLHDKGSVSALPVEINGVKVGALACSGVISPELYRNMTEKGAAILVNSASLDIFSHSQLYYEQSKQMARFQAAANARPFVQATLGGYSYIIDASGHFVSETKNKDTGYLESTVKTSSSQTIYTQIGEVILLISLFVISLEVFLEVRFKSKE